MNECRLFLRIRKDVEDRDIMADAFVALNAQRVLVNKVLNNVWTDDKLLMRVLTSLTALDEEPSKVSEHISCSSFSRMT